MQVVSKEKNLYIPPFLLVEQPKQQKQKRTYHPLAQIVGHFINKHFFNVPPFLVPTHFIERKNLFPYITQIVVQFTDTLLWFHTFHILVASSPSIRKEKIYFPIYPPKQVDNSPIHFFHTFHLGPPSPSRRKEKLFPIHPPKQLDNSLIYFFLIHFVFLCPLTFKKK